MDDPIQRLAGIIYAYRRLMYDLGMQDVREFIIRDPRQFDMLHRIARDTLTQAPPEVLKFEDGLTGEFYEQFEFYGVHIRLHLPGEHQRKKLEREREMARLEAKVRMEQEMMKPIPPMILTQAEIDRLGLVGLAPTPDGKIARKKKT